jgi:hypothetical protein
MYRYWLPVRLDIIIHLRTFYKIPSTAHHHQHGQVLTADKMGHGFEKQDTNSYIK